MSGRSLSVTLFAFVTATFLTANSIASTIVVGHDVNTLGTAVAGANEARFATNVAGVLTSGGSGKNLLLFESTAGDGTRDYSPTVLSALTGAGYAITVTTNYATSLTGYNAIFVGESYPSDTFLNNNALISYVNGGGSVYLVGGVDVSAASEAAGWNTFLNNYGLAFASSYNGLTNVPITSTNAIFAGVTSLNCGNGQDIVDLGTDSNAQILQTFQGNNVYAEVSVPTSSAVPEPATLSLVFGGTLLFLTTCSFARRSR